mgnify:CR=1 FL=1
MLEAPGVSSRVTSRSSSSRRSPVDRPHYEAALRQLLTAEGLSVSLVQTNAPYRPAWTGRIPMLRALFRLAPYLVRLWRATAEVDVVHVMANSGWSWHLFAAPAVRLASWRGTPVVVNYRGGEAGVRPGHGLLPRRCGRESGEVLFC